MRKSKALTQALRLIEPGAGFVLVVDRGEHVLVLGTDNADGRLRVLNGAGALEGAKPSTYRTDYYREILAALCRQFRGRVHEDALGVHFDVPAAEILAAMAEFDLATGGPRPLLS